MRQGNWVVILMAFVGASGSVRGADIGAAFTYQGTLEDGSGPVTNTCDFEFTLWDDAGAGEPPTGGVQIGATLTFDGLDGNPPSVLVTGGSFLVALDFGDGAIDGEARWLEIHVKCPPDEGYTTLAPRVELTPVPHALALPALWTTPDDNADFTLGDNLIAGHHDNVVGPGVGSAVIAGGGGLAAENSGPNQVSGSWGVIGGGDGNTAGPTHNNTVGGGYGNTASGGWSTISGGSRNNATGNNSTIGGGSGNGTDGSYSAVGGGFDNELSGLASTIAGGAYNRVSGDYSTVGGGYSNNYLVSSGDYATVGGGHTNSASGEYSTVGGGLSNAPSAVCSTVGGGRFNDADGGFSAVGGGDGNLAFGSHTSIGGGAVNQAFGDYSTVPGGIDNVAGGASSFAAGQWAIVRASHYFGADADGDEGTFAWADATEAPFYSTGANQFRIRASGGVQLATGSGTAPHIQGIGPADQLVPDSPVNLLLNPLGGNVGIGTSTPTAKLHVAGTAGVDGIRFPDGTLQTTAASFDADATPDTIADDGVISDAEASNILTIDNGLLYAPTSGNVGIGTSAPSARLHIASPASGSILALDGAGSTLESFLYTLPGATTGSAAISISSPNGSPGFTGIAENGNRRDIRFTDAGVSLLTSATASTPANDNGLIIDESGNVGIGTPSALSQLAVYEDGDSATQTVFTQDIASAGVNIVTDYVNGNYTPGLFWSTADNNASMPKAGIYLQETSLGSKMLFGTSANYATGITNDALTINPSGNLGVGRVSTANALEVEGNASKTASGSWLANSDCRIKTNVRTIKNALETIDRLRPVAFRYTDEYKAKHPSVKDQDYYNYIAQEFQEVFPDSVQSSGEDGILQMDSHPAGVYAIAAIQELHQIVQEKDHKIDGLREQNEALEARLAQLEAIIHLSLTEGENP